MRKNYSTYKQFIHSRTSHLFAPLILFITVIPDLASQAATVTMSPKSVYFSTPTPDAQMQQAISIVGKNDLIEWNA